MENKRIKALILEGAERFNLSAKDGIKFIQGNNL
jgi:hypothetical protein